MFAFKPTEKCCRLGTTHLLEITAAKLCEILWKGNVILLQTSWFYPITATHSLRSHSLTLSHPQSQALRSVWPQSLVCNTEDKECCLLSPYHVSWVLLAQWQADFGLVFYTLWEWVLFGIFASLLYLTHCKSWELWNSAILLMFSLSGYFMAPVVLFFILTRFLQVSLFFFLLLVKSQMVICGN